MPTCKRNTESGGHSGRSTKTAKLSKAPTEAVAILIPAQVTLGLEVGADEAQLPLTSQPSAAVVVDPAVSVLGAPTHG